MNTVLTPTDLPVYFVPTSNPSVPNHDAASTTAFALVHALLLTVTARQPTLGRILAQRDCSHLGLGGGFAPPSQSRQAT
jgi:hypothetical protein